MLETEENVISVSVFCYRNASGDIRNFDVELFFAH